MVRLSGDLCVCVCVCAELVSADDDGDLRAGAHDDDGHH